MRALFVSLYAATPHFETELELIADLLRDGHEVHVLRCTGQLGSCLANPEHRAIGCMACVSKIDRGLARVASPRLHVHVLEPGPLDPRLDVEHADMTALKTFTLDGVALGRGACASVCASIDKDTQLDTHEHAAAIRRQLRAAHQVYTATRRAIDRIGPERVYLFNGRFATTWPIVLAARAAGVDFYTHERGASAGHYLVRKNHLPHDIAPAHDEMVAAWERAGDDREAIASAWFEGRRNGAEHAWLSFTKAQQTGLMPPGFDERKHNIVIFNSTMEEYDTIESWANPLYLDEVVGMQRITAALRDRPDVHLWLRIHPNLKHIPRARNYQLRAYAELERTVPNLSVVWPESVVHTYALMDRARVVLTFGSTMGAESTFWRRPSVLAGRALYEGLDCAYGPRSHDELVATLLEPLEPKPQVAALKYGYWEATKGLRYKRFRPTGLFTGVFESEVVRPALLPTLLEAAERLLRR